MAAKLRTPNEPKDADRSLSVSDMVLLSTAEAADWTTSPVRYEEIVIHAWKAFPEQFSLQGHPEFPDASDVHKPLYREAKQGDLIESLGNKTFRVTDLGLSNAKSLIGELAQTFPLRRVIQIEAQPNRAAAFAFKDLIDAVGVDARPVAEQLVRAVLSIRFPRDHADKDHADAEARTANAGPSIEIGDTTFTVLIPASVEDVSEWAEFDSGGNRRCLLVRAVGVAQLQRMLTDYESSTNREVYGVETFLGQMIDGMGQYDETRTADVLQELIVAYNRGLPPDLPRLRLQAKDQSRE